jgi:leader peptidase (prepilin peptidase)/N-methyltransferase
VQKGTVLVMVVFDAPLFQEASSMLMFAALYVMLLAVALIDWRTRRIPNLFVGALLVLRLIGLGIACMFEQPGEVLALFTGSLTGALLVAGVLLALKGVMGRLLRKECLGMGDVKLVAAGYLFLAPDQMLFSLGVACFAGLVCALFFFLVHKDATFPFGPALCVGIALGALV